MFLMDRAEALVKRQYECNLKESSFLYKEIQDRNLSPERSTMDISICFLK